MLDSGDNDNDNFCAALISNSFNRQISKSFNTQKFLSSIEILSKRHYHLHF